MTLHKPALRRSKPESHPVLRAKLSRPNLGEHFLDRPRLVQVMHEHAQRPLTLLLADAGFGKTTLLASFAPSLRRPVVWYSLMPSDADPVVFGRYLLEGFRRESPRFGRNFQRALEEARPGGRSTEMLGGTLANDLAALRGPAHLLVLDDFQEVAQNPQVIALVDTLLRHLPPTVRMVIASRSMPPLSVERMRAKGELFELNSTHLRLTREELSKLFGEVYHRPLNEAELNALEETTLGWPTAVHLVHESLRRAGDLTLEEVLTHFRASDLELHDYLSVEVFTRLDEDSRRLLERTAALSRFDAGLAATLTGRPDPRATLEGLVRRGLLRTFGAGTQTSYECHELVRRFLRQEMDGRVGSEAWKALEADTGRSLEARGQQERALRHYLLAERDTEATRLLHELAPQLLKDGRPASLLQYLGDLPAERLREDLTLSVTQADARQALGQWDEAEPLYQAALERCRLSGAREQECRALLGLGKVLNLRGKHEQVLGMAERGLALSRDLNLEVRVRLLQMKAGAHFYLGQYQAAVQVLDQVRSSLPPSADPELVLPTVHNLAVAYHSQGRFREASEEFRAALAQVRGTASPRASLYLYNLALLLCDLGELADARRAAEEALLAAQRFSNRAQETTCHMALAQVLAQSGDLDGALAALRRAEELNSELRMEVIAADLLALRGRIFCARGQYRRAVEFLHQAIERLAERPDAPRLTEFQSTLAWCELRAGRPRVARDLLGPLVGRADASENDYQRMRVNYWLAESLRTLGEKREVDYHLGLALRLVRERGYHYFLKVEAREEPEPLLYALSRGIELDIVAGALAESGAEIEERLLALLSGASPAVGEAALSVLGEVGGRAARTRLETVAKTRRALQPAIRTALRHITERVARGAAAEEARTHAPRLLLFGPPRLLIEDRLAPASAWRSQRAFQVFVYLTLHPSGANKEELLERFWVGRRAAAGKRNFHPTLSYVRSALPQTGVAPILREGEFYRLNPSYPLTCDAWEMERAIEEGRRARDAAGKRMALETAVSLASGPFLQGFYGDWADELQARSRDRLEKLSLELGELCARASDFAAALEHFRRAAELDEFREATRVAVMDVLMRLGNRTSALAEYDKLKARLRAELGVEPLPETDEAVRRLLAGESVHGWLVRRPEESLQSKAPERHMATSQVRVKPRLGESRG